MSDMFVLYYWVLGDSTQQAFPVKILKTKDVGALKKVIKKENVNGFQSIDTCDLTLWKVSIPVADADSQLHDFQPEEDSSGRVSLLSPTYGLNKYFKPDYGPPLPKTIHIIVQTPEEHGLDSCSQSPSMEDVEKEIMIILDRHHPKIERFISGEAKPPTFDSTDIPVVNDMPYLCLHKLGEFDTWMEQCVNVVYDKYDVYIFTCIN